VHEVGGYEVDPAVLQRGDDSLRAASDVSRAALEQLRVRVAAALGTGWQGSAATAFRLGWEQWLDGVTAMLEALDEMAFTLGASADGYAETDNAVRTSAAGALQ
jgi:WXG100 family type VII secretion target